MKRRKNRRGLTLAALLIPLAAVFGYVALRYTHRVGPTSAGRVLRVEVDVGDRVRAGQLLAEIDPVDLDARVSAQRAALARAEANVQMADAQVSDASARATYAATQARRYGELARQGAASAEISDTKRQEQLVTEAAVAAARAAAEAAREELARARADADAIGRQRSNLRLVSPVDGLVSARGADPGSTVVAGQPVVEVIDPTTLWVNVRFDQLRTAGLRAGLPARISLRSRAGSELAGHVLRVEPLADSVTEELLAKVAFEGVPEPLRAVGELAEVTVARRPRRARAARLLVAGRHITRGHYEAVADLATGFRLGDRVRIRRNEYDVVGLTRRMVSSSGDPMVFVPLKDAQEAQFLKDADAIVQQRRRTVATPSLNPPGAPGVVAAVVASQTKSPYVNAVLVQVKPEHEPAEVAAEIQRWKRLQVYTRPQVEEILVGKLIATSARQIAMFLVILSVVSAAVVAFIIYTMTVGKIREIAVLKLIGARNRTIAAMIVQQAIALGAIAFVVGKIAATMWAPFFPKYVLLLPGDAARGFAVVMVICVLASGVAIRAALAVDPADAVAG